MAKPNFILPNKPAIKAGSILSYNYTDDLKFAAEPLDFSRNSSATRVNEQGLIEEVGYFGPQLIKNGDFSQEGSEEVTNGNFATDTKWTKGTGWTISGGSANCDGTQSGNTTLVQQNGIKGAIIDFVVGKTYKVNFDIIVTSGQISNVEVASSYDSNAITTSGNHTTYIRAVSTNDRFTITANPDFIGSIDNVSVKEVGQNWTFGTGWSMGDGVVSLNSPTGNLDQSLTATSGSKYRVTFTISNYVSGDIRWRFTGTSNENGTLRSANGTYTEEITLTNSQSIFRFPATGGVMDIDNVSVVEVLGDKPRIDYSDSSTEPSLLLEPQSTNLLTYSEDLTQGITNRLLITSNTNSSPDGTNTADKLIPNNTNSAYHYFAFSSLTIATNNVYSVFLKKAEYEYALISFETSGSSGSSDKALINLNNGTIEQSDTETKVENYGNGWYRCSIKATSSKTSVVIYPLASASLGSFTGDNVSGILAWGLQLEQNSYATSYIPTSGSTATRLGETANNAGGAGVFNSEEGVLYLEVSRFANDILNTAISINQNGDFTNSVSIKFRSTENLIFGLIYSSGNISTLMQYTLPDDTQFNKIAISYAENNFALWVNGIKVLTDTSGNAPIGLNNLSFNLGTELFYGKTKNLQVFNHALTDEELQTLTT